MENLKASPEGEGFRPIVETIIVGWGERSEPHQFRCGLLLVGLVSLVPPYFCT